MSALAAIWLLLLAVPAVFSAAYLGILTLCSAKPRLPPRSSRTLKFDVVVPAHNEAALIQRTIGSLLRLDWPHDRYRIVVVADNCTDATARLALAAGAEVLVRWDPRRRGKGYALAYAFRQMLAGTDADAVAVVDADSEVSANLLESFAARIELGAQAVQAHYGVREPLASWRTRLLTIAMAAFHTLRSRARERLHLSCGIRGNGWCVSSELLRELPYGAFSLAEDLEYGIALGLAGRRVHYADEAQVKADMAIAAATAVSQRQRWEDGRWQMVRSRTLPLLTAALFRSGWVCLDLAFDLLVPPLSYLALNIALLVASAWISAEWLDLGTGWLWLSLSCAALLLAHVLRGWQLSGLGRQGLTDLLRVPFFVGWKLAVMLRRRGSREWVRTKREGP